MAAIDGDSAEATMVNDKRELLLIEEDELIRAAVGGAFRHDGHSVHEAATLRVARDRLRARDPQLILLDVSLPDGDGLDLLCELRAGRSVVPVLMLTARGAEEQRIVDCEHGCDDYVVKPFSMRELRLRIAALLRRSTPPVERGPVRIGEVSVDLAERCVVRENGAERTLSPKEVDLLRGFLSRAGEVVSREELLRDVWGYDRLPVTRTVDMHVRRLREKIEVDPARPRHFLDVRGAGFRFEP